MAQFTNSSKLILNNENNTIRGRSRQWGILNEGSIYTLGGNDTLSGDGLNEDGIFNLNGINTGSGNDSVIGRGAAGLASEAFLFTKSGNDEIRGSGFYAGIWNVSHIKSGEGNDSIIGNGVRGGITNYNRLSTGIGSDLVRGKSKSGAGILNSRTIRTGRDNDTVDALVGGFAGGGKTLLGSDSDKLIGFGDGIFNGGRGNDALVQGQGTYTITEVSPRSIRSRVSDKIEAPKVYTITRQGDSSTMYVTGFETISGTSGPEYDFRQGVLSVSGSGSATFEPF